MIHLPYRSLTQLDSVQQSFYHGYLLLKQQAKPLVRKDGFIAKAELQKIADVNGESKGNLMKKIGRLVENELIEKGRYGYTLISTKKINRKLGLNSTRKGKEYTPFVKIENAKSLNHIELLRLYFLIVQIRSQYLYQKNGRITRRTTSQAPEYFELSLDKICKRGKYDSKMTVNRMIDALVSLKLLNRIKGKMNNEKIGHYDCNQYQITGKSPFKVNWNLLSTSTAEDNFKKFLRESDKESFGSNKKKLRQSRILLGSTKKKAEYSEIEQKLHAFMKAGCQDILVDNGILSRHFRSFGSRCGRKVSRSMFSKILVAILNDTELRKIFLTVFDLKDVLVIENAEGMAYNPNLDVPRYRAFNSFKYDHVELVNDRSGNYDDFQDVVLKSREVALRAISNNYFNGTINNTTRTTSS